MFIAPKDVTTALWFYAGLEGQGDVLLVNEEDHLVNPPIPQRNRVVLNSNTAHRVSKAT